MNSARSGPRVNERYLRENIRTTDVYANLGSGAKVLRYVLQSGMLGPLMSAPGCMYKSPPMTITSPRTVAFDDDVATEHDDGSRMSVSRAINARTAAGGTTTVGPESACVNAGGPPCGSWIAKVNDVLPCRADRPAHEKQDDERDTADHRASSRKFLSSALPCGVITDSG